MGNCTGICGKDMVEQTIVNQKEKMEQQVDLQVVEQAIEDMP